MSTNSAVVSLEIYPIILTDWFNWGWDEMASNHAGE